ncbi:MAG: fatty acid desaturase family protein [Pseudobdellovibrionaceae bacterium]
MADLKSTIDQFKLDPAVRKWVKEHSEARPGSHLLMMAFDWLCIGVTCALSLRFPHPALFTLSVMVIGCRQHALLVLAHDGAHNRISKNSRANDLFSNLFCGYPTLLSTKDYRRHHLAHHQHTNTDADPDWARKIQMREWQYPQNRVLMFTTMLKVFFVGGPLWIYFMSKMTQDNGPKMLYWACVLGVVTYLQAWPLFLLYWALPLMTVFQVIQRIRSIAEHFGLPRAHELNDTRNILAGPIEKFLLSPHNVNYHLTHHLFPSVPFSNLPGLHQKLNEHPIYRALAHNNDSFLFGKRSVLHDLRTCSQTESKETEKIQAAA